jgi:trk system potassium uptake protein TrkH
MTARNATTLLHAVRPRVVFKYLGQILLVLAALSTVPLGAGLALHDFALAWRLGLVLALVVGIALPLARLPVPQQVQWNEALSITALAFLVAPLIMVFPLTAYGLSPLDAWFEAVSGITTTGLSSLASPQAQPPLLLFTRAWMQWYGGLGIAVLSVALVMRHHASGKRLLESSGEEDLAASARTHAQRLLAVYLLLTVAGVALLWALAGDGFVAILHALAAVSTGGFSGFDDNLAAVSLPMRAAVMVLCLFGAIGLPLLYRVHQRGPRVLLADPEVRALAVATLLVAGLLALLLRQGTGLGWAEATGHGLLLGASAQSTAGFNTLDPADLDPATQLVLMFSMAVGGCAGSTAGGFKLVRLLILLRLVELALRRSAAPARAVMPMRVGGERVESDSIVGALVLLGLWALLVTLSWLAFLVHGHDPMDALFEIVSATATVGLSTGISSPSLAPALKLVLGLDMLFGRVEIVALLVLLYPRTWIGRRRQTP